MLLTYLLETKLHPRAYEAWRQSVSKLCRRKTLNKLQTFLEQCKFLTMITPRVCGWSKSIKPQTQGSLRESLHCGESVTAGKPVCCVPRIIHSHDARSLRLSRSMTESPVSKSFNCLRTRHGANACNNDSCKQSYETSHTHTYREEIQSDSEHLRRL